MDAFSFVELEEVAVLEAGLDKAEEEEPAEPFSLLELPLPELLLPELSLPEALSEVDSMRSWLA